MIDNFSQEKISSLESSEDIILWLEKNGYHEEALMLLFKQIIRGLLADFGHFTYEALNCSQKGKLSVTFALLRKAFKDHLIYFEWLLGDPEEFMEIFKNGKIDELSIDRNWEKRVNIIEKAMKKLRSYWGSPEFIYETRYDKKSIFSFEQIWQQANHLVTLCREYKTEPMNFNFIFSDYEDKKKQWGILYSLLPFLLIHTYHVIEELFKQFATRVNEETDITDLRVMMGFFVFHNKFSKNSEAEILIQNVFSECGLDKIPCQKCKHNLNWSKENIENFYGQATIKCNYCKEEINLLTNKIASQFVKSFNRE